MVLTPENFAVVFWARFAPALTMGSAALAVLLAAKVLLRRWARRPASGLSNFEALVLLHVATFPDGASTVELRRSLENFIGREISVGLMFTVLDRLMVRKHLVHWVERGGPERGVGPDGEFRRVSFYKVSSLEPWYPANSATAAAN